MTKILPLPSSFSENVTLNLDILFLALDLIMKKLTKKLYSTGQV